MPYLPGGGGFQLFGKIKIKYGSGRFSGSGADDHQLIFLIWHQVGILIVESCSICKQHLE